MVLARVPAVCEGNACRLTDIAGDRSNCPTELETPNYRRLRCFGVMLGFLSSHAATRENAESSHDCGCSVTGKYRSRLRQFRKFGQVFRRPCDRGGVLPARQMFTATGSIAPPGSARLPPSRSPIGARLPPSRIPVRARHPPSRPHAEPTSCRCPAHLRSSGVEDAGVRLLIGLVQQNEDSAASYDYFAPWRLGVKEV